MVSYRVMLDVPKELVVFVAGLLAARRREIGTRRGTRKLTCHSRRCSGWHGSGTKVTPGGWERASGWRRPPPTGT